VAARLAGLQKGNGEMPRPRIHDLRHTFACRSCWLGIVGVKTFTTLSRRSRPTWGTAKSPTVWYLTGNRNSWRLSAAVSSGSHVPRREVKHENAKIARPRIPLGSHIAALLLRVPRQPTRSKPEDHWQLSRHFRLLLAFMERCYRIKPDVSAWTIWMHRQFWRSWIPGTTTRQYRAHPQCSASGNSFVPSLCDIGDPCYCR